MPNRLLLAGLLALLPAVPARAIIVYETPGRLTTMPVLAGGVKPGWQYIGNAAATGLAGIPIGPRAWVTATHVLEPGSMQFYYANAGTTGTNSYYGTLAAVSGDLAVMVLDAGQPDFLEWAPVWSSTSNLAWNQEIYMYGFGVARGDPISNDYPVAGTPKGWGWDGGPWSYALSYGTNQLDGLWVDGGGNIYIVMDFNQPNAQNNLPGTEGMYARYDSGGGIFSLNPATNRWELLGINWSIDAVSATSGGQPFGAALYDARGFYGGQDGTTLITGSTQVPLSSYATALPFKYDVLAPYIPLPEPGAAGLAGAAAGLLALRRSLRRETRSTRRRPASGTRRSRTPAAGPA